MKKAEFIILLAITLMAADSCSVIHYFVSHRTPAPFPTTAEAALKPPTSSKSVENKDIPSPAEMKVHTADPNEHLRQEIVGIAQTKLGCTYKYAGKGPDIFDCSGFTGWVFRQVGITLSASSASQYSDGKAIPSGEALKPGDLVFFGGRKDMRNVGHVGIVVDYDRTTRTFTFIHAATSTGIEMQKSTAAYYAARYIGARRIIED